MQASRTAVEIMLSEAPSPRKLTIRARRGSAAHLHKYSKDALFRSRTHPYKMLLALAIAVVLFVFTTGNSSWESSTPGPPARPSPATEKSERKLMGSVPHQPAHRACTGPPPAGNTDMDAVPALMSIQRWGSAKERPRESISLVTHLSIDRLPALENQCITWPDHLVAIVYLSIVGNSTGGPPVLPMYSKTSLDDVIRGIDSLHNFMETTAACAFHIELVGQFIEPGNFPGPYPINALRNRALALAPTDLAIPVDTDFVATPMLGLPGTGYRDPGVFAQMEAMASRRQAVVLPTLELTNKWQDLTLSRNVARDLVIAGKEMARGALIGGVMSPYRPPNRPTARDVANTSHWATAASPELYEIQYDSTTEPCVLVSLVTVPWFDERFVDYGAGASTWLAHLAASNFTFLVHPFAFLVHVPHTRPAPTSQYMEAQKRMREERMDRLREQILGAVKEGTYAPVLRECIAQQQQQGEDAADKEAAGEDGTEADAADRLVHDGDEDDLNLEDVEGHAAATKEKQQRSGGSSSSSSRSSGGSNNHSSKGRPLAGPQADSAAASSSAGRKSARKGNHA